MFTIRLEFLEFQNVKSWDTPQTYLDTKHPIMILKDAWYVHVTISLI